MANNRIFYATQNLTLTGVDKTGTAGSAVAPLGVQSVGMTTNIPLEQVFTVGQIELYDNLENVPDIQVTINKVIDGTAPLYALCMGGGATDVTGKNIVEMANNRVNVELSIFPDTQAAATGSADYNVTCTGMYLSNFSFNLPVDGNGTEDVTLVGNNKLWATGGSGGGNFGELVSSGTFRRYNFRSSTPEFQHLQSVKISADLGREPIYELGSFKPYHRYVKFPLEVSSEFEIIAIGSDGRSASDDAPGNAPYETVNVLIGTTGNAGDTLEFDLGDKNKLTSVNYAGGDTGGANVTMTYSYKTYNYFILNQSGTFASV